jgi:hypothetical protein
MGRGVRDGTYNELSKIRLGFKFECGEIIQNVKFTLKKDSLLTKRFVNQPRMRLTEGPRYMCKDFHVCL